MPSMKLKGPKNKKTNKLKIFLILVIIYLSLSLTFYYSMKNNKMITNEEFIIFLLNNGNANFTKDYKFTNVINKTVNYILKIDFTNPVSLFNGTILNSSNNQDKDDDEFYDIDKLKEISSYISDPNKIDEQNPLIYLYNSHQLENYNNYNLEIYGITPNVLMASYLLKEKLNERGLSTIVEDTNLTEFITLNNWSYNNSYKASRIFLLDKKNTYPSLKYFIDIHRDSVNREISTVKISNQNYARILFVVGLEHNKYQKNLDFTNKLNDISNKLYPGLSRGVLKKSGEGVDGIYNQDVNENVILIEIGGIDNNIEEVLLQIEKTSKTGKNKKAIQQLDKNGKVLAEFESASAAGRSLGKAHAGIAKAAREGRTAYGYL